MPIFMNIPALSATLEVPVATFGDGYGVNITPFAVQYAPVGVTLPYFALFPGLMVDGSAGKLLPAVQFTFTMISSTGKPEVYMKISLSNAEITGFAITDGSSALPFLEMAFHWQKMAVITYDPATGKVISEGLFSQG